MITNITNNDILYNASIYIMLTYYRIVIDKLIVFAQFLAYFLRLEFQLPCCVSNQYSKRGSMMLCNNA